MHQHRRKLPVLAVLVVVVVCIGTAHGRKLPGGDEAPYGGPSDFVEGQPRHSDFHMPQRQAPIIDASEPVDMGTVKDNLARFQKQYLSAIDGIAGQALEVEGDEEVSAEYASRMSTLERALEVGERHALNTGSSSGGGGDDDDVGDSRSAGVGAGAGAEDEAGGEPRYFREPTEEEKAEQARATDERATRVAKEAVTQLWSKVSTQEMDASLEAMPRRLEEGLASLGIKLPPRQQAVEEEVEEEEDEAEEDGGTYEGEGAEAAKSTSRPAVSPSEGKLAEQPRGVYCADTYISVARVDVRVYLNVFERTMKFRLRGILDTGMCRDNTYLYTDNGDGTGTLELWRPQPCLQRYLDLLQSPPPVVTWDAAAGTLTVDLPEFHIPFFGKLGSKRVVLDKLTCPSESPLGEEALSNDKPGPHGNSYNINPRKLSEL